MPVHAKRVHLWKDATPIFAKHGVEKQLEVDLFADRSR